jgi:hypothetical protein
MEKKGMKKGGKGGGGSFAGAVPVPSTILNLDQRHGHGTDVSSFLPSKTGTSKPGVFSYFGLSTGKYRYVKQLTPIFNPA